MVAVAASRSTRYTTGPDITRTSKPLAAPSSGADPRRIVRATVVTVAAVMSVVATVVDEAVTGGVVVGEVDEVEVEGVAVVVDEEDRSP